MKYGRIVNNTIQEVFEETDNKTLTDFFHKDLASLFQEIPEKADYGYYLDNGVWTAPPQGDPMPETTDTPE